MNESGLAMRWLCTMRRRTECSMRSSKCGRQSVSYLSAHTWPHPVVLSSFIPHHLSSPQASTRASNHLGGLQATHAQHASRTVVAALWYRYVTLRTHAACRHASNHSKNMWPQRQQAAGAYDHSPSKQGRQTGTSTSSSTPETADNGRAAARSPPRQLWTAYGYNSQGSVHHGRSTGDAKDSGLACKKDGRSPEVAMNFGK
jgi:hypothetical protein